MSKKVPSKTSKTKPAKPTTLEPELHISKKSSLISESALASVFNQERDLVMFGCSNGDIKAFSSKDNKPVNSLHVEAESMPVTGIGKTADQPGVIGVTYASGYVRWFHVSSQQMLTQVEVAKAGINCMAVSFNRMAVGCSDHLVRMLDQKTHQCTGELGMTSALLHTDLQYGLSAHTNRVFAVCFDPGNPEILYSGGWDRVVMMWDLRQQRPVNHISGPFICGDGIQVDPISNRVITASYVAENALQVWDLRSLKNQYSTFSGEETSMLYTCQLHPKKKNLVLTGGCKANELRVFDIENQTIAASLQFEHGIYACSWDDEGHNIVCSGELEGALCAFEES